MPSKRNVYLSKIIGYLMDQGYFSCKSLLCLNTKYEQRHTAPQDLNLSKDTQCFHTIVRSHKDLSTHHTHTPMPTLIDI